MSYFPPTTEVVSSGNSTTTPLAGGATFTGTAIDTTAIPIAEVCVTVYSDQVSDTLGLQVQYSSNNSNWDFVNSITVYAGIPATLSVGAHGRYFRVVYKNGPTAQGTFRLQTMYSQQILSPAYDSFGSQKVSIASLADQYGFTGQFNPVHGLQVNEPYRLVGTVYGASIDTNFWTATNVGVASAAGVASSIATLTSGTDNSGYGKIVSVRSARFIFVHPVKFRAAIRLTALTKAKTTRAWGLVTLSTVAPQDGAYFSVNENDVLSVNYASGGSVTSVASGSFNGNTKTIVLDTNVHAYEIIAFTMGIWFFVDGNLIHTVTPTTAILYSTLTVPISIWSTNSASGTTSATLECWNAAILRLGRDTTSPTAKYQSGTTAALVLKLSPGNLHRLLISGVLNNSVVTLYDNTAASGTVLFSTGAMSANTTPFGLDFENTAFFTGLTLAITAANSNATVVYE